MNKNNFKTSKLFFWTVQLLAMALLLFVCTKIDFIFSPIGTFISTLFIPVVIAGFLYYMLNPLVLFLEKFKVKRTLAVLIIFVLMLALIILLMLTVIPNLLSQIGDLASNMPKLLKQGQELVNDFLSKPSIQELNLTDKINTSNFSVEKIVSSVIGSVTNSVGSIIGAVTNITIVVLTVPLILFYMFKDGDKFAAATTRFIPESYRKEGIVLMGKMGDTISSYISGQALVCLFVGICTFIGYLIIGMPYALLLGFIAGLTNIIPYVGPWFGVAPALIVAVIDSPFKAVLVGVVVLIIQQIDGNFISPNVIGKSLNLHPLTIIIILLVAGNIAGIMGMILGVPFYAVSKTVVNYVYDLYKLKRKHEKNKEETA
ncbi:AI-2E family transporter [Isobaculum melis]|uniref:Predicted PurR-regulated permease PerM n=1 Tax=Isobaculum melis TaxID=142588 RepID=A0A1H9T9N1_9LACT|nr:AI-2E family transporter [Isobaculum melis]SER93644.1 Predicted PurR-regulated permease PerM [Isobaculum melis]